MKQIKMTRDKKKEDKPSDVLGDNLKSGGIRSNASIKYTDKIGKDSIRKNRKQSKHKRKIVLIRHDD